MDSAQNWMDHLPTAAAAYLERHSLAFVECVIGDFAGRPRGLTRPVEAFAARGRFHMPVSIFSQTITGQGAETPGLSAGAPDMTLRPDLSSATPMAHSPDGRLQIVHDATDLDGRPIGLAPRNIIKRVVRHYTEQGWVPRVAPAVEVYFLAQQTDPARIVEPWPGQVGGPPAMAQSYRVDATDAVAPVIDEVLRCAKIQGFDIDAVAQSEGPAQVQIALPEGDPVPRADQLFFLKGLIRAAAQRHGCCATFMAKPMADAPGSTLLVRHMVSDAATGRSLFSASRNGPAKPLSRFIGGLQAHLPVATPLIAPYLNSYLRLSQNNSEAVNLAWGQNARATGIAVSTSDPAKTYVESRVAGMDCNPYLGLAASLACGYLGLVENRTPTREHTGDTEVREQMLPHALPDALGRFRDAHKLRTILGEEFAKAYEHVKTCEYGEVLQHISPLERTHLLLNV